jgi:metal-responsive CopG/Arc/MetJ family transcriptional regulator
MVSTTTTMRIYNEDRTEKLGITLPVKLLQKIDNIRGDVPRSKFIRRATESYLKGRWSKNGN